MYEPWHKRHRSPPCGPCLASNNISPNNKVNTGYNGQYSDNEQSSTSGGQLRQIDKSLYTSTSPSQWTAVRLGGRTAPIVGSIVEHTIQKEAFGEEQKGQARHKLWTQSLMDRALFGERARCAKTSARCILVTRSLQECLRGCGGQT
jgi:hypothetical protein